MKLSTKKLVTQIAFLIATVAMIVYFMPREKVQTLSYEENKPWTHPLLRAPFEILIYPDSAAVVDSLGKAFVPIYNKDLTMAESVVKTITKEKHIPKKIEEKIREQYNKGVVSIDDYAKIEKGELPDVRVIDENGKELTKETTADYVTPRTLYLMIDTIAQDSISNEFLRTVNLSKELNPNISYNELRSSQEYERDLVKATAPLGIIMQNERIIDRGEIVTPEKYRILNTYQEMLKQQAPDSERVLWYKLMGQILYVSIFILMLYLYLQHFCSEIIYRKGSLLFILLMIGLLAVGAIFATSVLENGIYIVPFIIIPILVLVFFDARTALFCHLIEILICASFAPFPFEFIVVQFSAGTIAIYTLKELSKRSQLLRTALFALIASVVSYVAIEILHSGEVTGSTFKVLGYFAINAVLTSFAYILIFVVEKLFGFVSVVTLVELSDINNPLLRELSEQCPGTFQHSMAVSNLAADAVGRIGGNVQLVRTGALYHDIGKLENPIYFTENQSGVNPHDELDPIQSAEIVIGHVSNGLKRASKEKLPKVIQDFISQHHGSGKAKYFYITYCKDHPDEEVDESLFTYPGTNPTTKESSVLMMADAVEAASRSLPEHSVQAITNLVNRIIDSQIADGLHNDAPISFRDIKVVKEAFINRVSTMYHSRIAYPEQDKKQQPTQN